LPSDRLKLADPELYFASHEDNLVILDQIHRSPGIFQVLRGVIDRRGRKGIKVGELLVPGSASMDLLRQYAETLAGRIAYLEPTPFTALEVVKNDTSVAGQLWVWGRFPDIRVNLPYHILLCLRCFGSVLSLAAVRKLRPGSPLTKQPRT
jgi:hypothetical protein